MRRRFTRRSRPRSFRKRKASRRRVGKRPVRALRIGYRW